jgi:hypothetical protein
MRGTGRISIKDSTFKDYSTSVGLRLDNNGWSGNVYINVTGCVFEGNRYGASALGSGMLDYALFDDCMFVDNSIGYYASTWGTRYTTFSRSTFMDNDTGIAIEGTYWYWLKSYSNTIHRCIFSNNQTGILIGQEDGGSHSGCAYDNHVINSTFYDNRDAGIFVNTNFSRSNDRTPEWLDAQGQTFVNNIFLSNGTYGIDNNVNQTIFNGYSLAYDNGIAPGNNAVFDLSNNSLTEDPSLVAPDFGDFRLASGSVCIDAGDPAYDSDPYVAGEHIDIGAFEYDNPTPPEIVTGLIDTFADVPESFLNNKNNSIPVSKKLYVVLKTVTKAEEETDPVIRANLYHASLQKLIHDILPKTDGCAATGTPDNNDWITDCETQSDFYDPIVSLIGILEAL